MGASITAAIAGVLGIGIGWGAHRRFRGTPAPTVITRLVFPSHPVTPAVPWVALVDWESDSTFDPATPLEETA